MCARGSSRDFVYVCLTAVYQDFALAKRLTKEPPAGISARGTSVCGMTMDYAYARLWVNRTECTGLSSASALRGGRARGSSKVSPAQRGGRVARRTAGNEAAPPTQPWNWYSSSGPTVAAATLFQATLSVNGKCRLSMLWFNSAVLKCYSLSCCSW